MYFIYVACKKYIYVTLIFMYMMSMYVSISLRFNKNLTKKYVRQIYKEKIPITKVTNYLYSTISKTIYNIRKYTITYFPVK